MERVIVRLAKERERETMRLWLGTTRDGELYDHDVLEHDSSFLLSAAGESGRMGYLPVQQPLMLENLVFRPGLGMGQTSVVMTRLAEHAVSEAYRRDAGELYFLCRDQSTCDFAVRHKFRHIPEKEMKLYRLNLLETFGA
jgi:hypothetical protein